MAASAIGCEDAEWFTFLPHPVGARGASAMESMLLRRISGEPLQYVLGNWGFRTLDLMVDERVFIPRPETEVTAGIALEELRRQEQNDRETSGGGGGGVDGDGRRLRRDEGLGDHGGLRDDRETKGGQSRGGSAGRLTAADLGCGSGAIGFSLAAEHPNIQVYCTDVSVDALAVARSNLAGLGESAKRVRLSAGSWYEALPEELRGRLSLVVSNPPYIADSEPLPPSVTEYEPALALRSGATGLEDIRTILAGAPNWLSPGGAVVLETPESAAETALALAAEAGLADARIHQDLAGRSRVLVARRPIAPRPIAPGAAERSSRRPAAEGAVGRTARLPEPTPEEISECSSSPPPSRPTATPQVTSPPSPPSRLTEEPPSRPAKLYSLEAHHSKAAAAAAAALIGEEVVLLPTDTVYGLAVKPASAAATNRLFELKRRPSEVSVAVLIGDPADVSELAEDPPAALTELTQRHWPGPLTVVLPRRKTLDWALGGGVSTIGLRCPDDDWLRGLLRQVGPLAVTSANLHGQPTPATAGEVLKMLGEGVSVAVDGGMRTGRAYTVVAWQGGVLEVLRQGPLRVQGR